MAASSEKAILYCKSQEEWQRWLGENGGGSPGVRLQLVKKASSLPGMSYAEALDVALCFGWIDGKMQALDDDFFVQSFTPRTARSVWSKRNREHVARLTAEGRMQPAGLAQVEAAKADGRWDAAYRQADAEIPDDLRQALAANPAASELFARLSSRNRFAILFRIGSVKREETRARRIAEFVAMLARGETVYPQR